MTYLITFYRTYFIILCSILEVKLCVFIFRIIHDLCISYTKHISCLMTFPYAVSYLDNKRSNIKFIYQSVVRGVNLLLNIMLYSLTK